MLRYILTLLLLVVSAPIMCDTPKPFTNKAAFQLAETLPLSGELRNKDGYIYLKVDDRYINAIFPLLTQPHIMKPPYFRRADSPGAHISVIYEGETKHLGPISEVGSTFSFTLRKFATVKVGKDKKVYLLEVYAPELEALRHKYGLHHLLQGHEFHITVALRKMK